MGYQVLVFSPVTRFALKNQSTECIDVRPFTARIVIPWIFALLLAAWLAGMDA